MSSQSVKILSSLSVPNLAGLIVRPCDKLSPVLVKSAVGQRVLVTLQFFTQLKILMLVRSDSNDKFLYQINQVMFLAVRNQRLLVKDLIHELLDVRLFVQVEQIDRFDFLFTVGLDVLQNDTRRVVPDKELLEFHYK